MSADKPKSIVQQYVQEQVAKEMEPFYQAFGRGTDKKPASADKTRAARLADKLDAMRDVDFDSVFVPAAAELRRIPALEAERDRLRAQLETLKARFREAAADAVESMPAGLLTCDATGSASDSYVAQWKAAEVLRNLDL